MTSTRPSFLLSKRSASDASILRHSRQLTCWGTSLSVCLLRMVIFIFSGADFKVDKIVRTISKCFGQRGTRMARDLSERRLRNINEEIARIRTSQIVDRGDGGRGSKLTSRVYLSEGVQAKVDRLERFTGTQKLAEYWDCIRYNVGEGGVEGFHACHGRRDVKVTQKNPTAAHAQVVY